MELLEFKHKMFDLCGVSEIAQIRDVLYNATLSQDVAIFNGYNSIIDDTKDWLQALWQYYEADRTEKKQDYTPKSLCRLVSELAGDCKSVYDCCGGAGAVRPESGAERADRRHGAGTAGNDRAGASSSEEACSSIFHRYDSL